jgi:hypothetical protein
MITGLVFLAIIWGIPIWGIVDAAMKPDPVWRAAGQNKVVWIILQVVLGIIGTAIYVFAIRPKLVAAASG